jgi:hypothetical protein
VELVEWMERMWIEKMRRHERQQPAKGKVWMP